MYNGSIIINPEKIKAIIFDFDGVIIDSNHIKTEAFKELFSNYDDEIVDKILSHHLQNGGMSRYDKIKYYFKEIIKEKISKEKQKQLYDKFGELTFENVLKAKFVEGCEYFLKNNFFKFDMYIVSATPKIELQKIVKARSLSKYFKKVLGSPKSKVENINCLIKKYNYQIDQVVYIGDSLNDYLAANENKITFISIVN